MQKNIKWASRGIKTEKTNKLSIRLLHNWMWSFNSNKVFISEEKSEEKLTWNKQYKKRKRNLRKDKWKIKIISIIEQQENKQHLKE